VIAPKKNVVHLGEELWLLFADEGTYKLPNGCFVFHITKALEYWPAA
jgi:hypothetical protein